MTELLPLREDPVVVPADEQVGRSQDAQRRRPTDVELVGRLLDQVERRPQAVQVDGDRLRQRDVVAPDLDGGSELAPELPERGTEAGSGAALRVVRPQEPGEHPT